MTFEGLLPDSDWWRSKGAFQGRVRQRSPLGKPLGPIFWNSTLAWVVAKRGDFGRRFERDGFSLPLQRGFDYPGQVMALVAVLRE